MWRSLLDGSRRAAVRAALDEIVARQLARPPADDAIEACSLMTGDVGRAVFLAYLARAGEPRAEAAATQLLERAGERLGDASALPTFHRGFAGCGWAFAHLADEDTSAIDDALLEIATARPDWLAFEWLTGAAGFAIYALERRCEPLLAQLLDYLDATATRDGELVSWLRRDEGVYPLDPPHGATGALAALAGIAAAGVEVERALALVDGTLRWLVAQRLEREDAAFPCYGGLPGVALKWCEGDPGIAGALAATGELLGRPDVTELGRMAAERVARAVATAERPDRSLCHGWAGLAHILARVHARTGDARLAEGALVAWDRTLATAPDDDDSLLTGGAGVGLAMLSALEPIEPEWDRALCLSFAHG